MYLLLVSQVTRLSPHILRLSDATTLLAMETADQDAFAEDVSLHRRDNGVARGIRTEIQLRIQRDQLKRVVMIRARGGAPGPMKPTFRPVFTI